MIEWISHFIQFNRGPGRRLWGLQWATYETMVWTPWITVHWRRDIFRALKWEMVIWRKA